MLAPIKRYWGLYGGWIAFLSSPYLVPAALLAVICLPLWAHPEKSGWADISISVMPSLMGFSIAAMTVMLAFSDSKSLKAVTQGGKENSFFVTTVANLMHFLVAQIVALLIAVIGKAYPYWFVAYPGVLAFFYAVVVSIAAAGQLLNTARIINKAASLPDNPTPPLTTIDGGSENQLRSGTGPRR